MRPELLVASFWAWGLWCLLLELRLSPFTFCSRRAKEEQRASLTEVPACARAGIPLVARASLMRGVAYVMTMGLVISNLVLCDDERARSQNTCSCGEATGLAGSREISKGAA